MSRILEKLWDRAKAEVAALRAESATWWAPRVLVGVAVVLGMVGLTSALNAWLSLIPLAFAALVAIPGFDRVAGRVVGAVILATIALVGFNVLTYFVTSVSGKVLDVVLATVMFGLALYGVTRRRKRWKPGLIGCLAVLGLGLLTDVIGGRTAIVVGLVVALLLFGLVANWYLSGADWGSWVTRGLAAVVAILAIVVPPIVLGGDDPEKEKVAGSERVRSELDVLIVTDGSRHPRSQNPVRDPARGFDVRYSVGYASGGDVRWTRADELSAEAALRVAARGDAAPVRDSGPTRRLGADAVVVLLVDGTDPVTEQPERLREEPGGGRPEVERWRRVARAARGPIADDAPATPSFPLLQTTSTQRLRLWKRFLPPGRAVSLQELASQTVADAGVRLSVGAPTSQGDFKLALAHRPLLLFDRDEPVPRPLSVASLFVQDRVSLCHDREVTGTTCDPPIRDARLLENGGTHIQIRPRSSRELRDMANREKPAIADATRGMVADPSEAGAAPGPTPPPSAPVSGAEDAALGRESTMYVHPVSIGNMLYLDYWWYLSDNPAEGLGLGAFCGAGFVIPGVTCHDHQSDWEGMTVVVDRSADTPVVTAVQYAQHDDVLRYDWEALLRRWSGSTRRPANELRVDPALVSLAEASGRPLAFVALGTHSTYPTPCDSCRQVANSSIKEDTHRGDLPWIGNYRTACGDQDCLQVLPTREAGFTPALWNAFDGPWGERRCVFKHYCDSGTAPAAPGTQDRYTDPTHYDGVVDEAGRFTRQASP